MNILIVHGTQRSFYRHPCGGNRYRPYDKACRSPMSLFHVKEIAGLLLSLIEIPGSHVADLDQFRQIEVPLKRGMLQGLPIGPSGEQRQLATESQRRIFFRKILHSDIYGGVCFRCHLLLYILFLRDLVKREVG